MWLSPFLPPFPLLPASSLLVAPFHTVLRNLVLAGASAFFGAPQWLFTVSQWYKDKVIHRNKLPDISTTGRVGVIISWKQGGRVQQNGSNFVNLWLRRVDHIISRTPKMGELTETYLFKWINSRYGGGGGETLPKLDWSPTLGSNKPCSIPTFKSSCIPNPLEYMGICRPLRKVLMILLSIYYGFSSCLSLKTAMSFYQNQCAHLIFGEILTSGSQMLLVSSTQTAILVLQAGLCLMGIGW